MKKWFVLGVALAAVSAMVLDAGAAEEKKAKGGAKGGPSFSKMDANADGSITVEEFQAARNASDEATMKKAAAAFKKMDADGNGKVCEVEFKKWQDAMAEQRKAGGAKPEGKKPKQ